MVAAAKFRLDGGVIGIQFVVDLVDGLAIRKSWMSGNVRERKTHVDRFNRKHRVGVVLRLLVRHS